MLTILTTIPCVRPTLNLPYDRRDDLCGGSYHSLDNDVALCEVRAKTLQLKTFPYSLSRCLFARANFFVISFCFIQLYADTFISRFWRTTRSNVRVDFPFIDKQRFVANGSSFFAQRTGITRRRLKFFIFNEILFI